MIENNKSASFLLHPVWGQSSEDPVVTIAEVLPLPPSQTIGNVVVSTGAGQPNYWSKTQFETDAYLAISENVFAEYLKVSSIAPWDLCWKHTNSLEVPKSLENQKTLVKTWRPNKIKCSVPIRKLEEKEKIVLLSCFDNDQEENIFTAHIWILRAPKWLG